MIDCLTVVGKNRRLFVTFLSIFLFFIIMGMSSAQPTVDRDVIDELNVDEFVQVVVVLKDLSNLNYPSAGTIQERRQIYELRKELNKQTRADILFTLSIDELRLDHVDIIGRSFWGNITKKGLDKIRNNDNILRVHLPIKGSIALQQSLPLINATTVWASGYTGRGQTVCVVDSGVNYSNSNLGGCAATSNISDGSCKKVIAGYDFRNNDGNPMDDNGHGTHVAGIVAANGTINGTAPDAKLVAVKVSDNQGGWTDQDLVDGIDWCNDNRDLYNISVITISLGSYTLYNDAAICDASSIGVAVTEAHNNGVFVDASSGNDANTTHLNLPACATDTVAVGAVYDANVGAQLFLVCADHSTAADQITCFTNRGALLDLLAPGSLITSTGSGGTSGCAGDATATCSGTSQAAPHVAGTAALLLERDPSLTPDEIQNTLQDTGKLISSWKRIDALAAINSLCVCTSWSAGSCGAGSCSASQRQSTRTCSPLGCQVEVSCNYDPTCLSGATITVCASGCSYTTISAALSNSDPSDLISVTDSRTYNENVVITENTASRFECTAGAKIVGSSGYGINVKSYDNADDLLITGCYIEGFNRGIYVNKSITYGLIQNNTLVNNNIGIYLDEDSDVFKIIDNNITLTGDYAIRTFANSWANGPSYGRIKNNKIHDNGIKGMWIRYGLENTIELNNISTSGTSSGEVGIHIHSGSQTANHQISQNTISENYDGVYVQGANNNQINNNVFCASNLNTDIIISSSEGNSGDNNRCERPGSWNDNDATGCTYLCDPPPTVILLDPLDNSQDLDGNVSFTCYAEDNSQLVNITLYQNISGSWQANQTNIVSGISNMTTFAINNIANGTTFIWNCLAFDNRSRSSFASANWTLTINITTMPSLDVKNLEVVYSNLTERIFKFLINNTLTTTLGNISWSLDTGNGNKTSQYNSTLQGGENVIIFAYHNYTTSGNYTVRATAYNIQYSDTEVLQIQV